MIQIKFAGNKEALNSGPKYSHEKRDEEAIIEATPLKMAYDLKQGCSVKVNKQNHVGTTS